MEDLKQILNSGTGQALKDYLLKKLHELRNIENIKEYSTTASQALEMKAQKRAYKKLKEIMAEIIIFSEEAKKKDERDSYYIE